MTTFITGIILLFISITLMIASAICDAFPPQSKYLQAIRSKAIKVGLITGTACVIIGAAMTAFGSVS